ncbi:MAG: hypothetical protein PHS45_02995 [Bacilli bacterium]|nr:hypothetical protein [Bacilli bacterium]
MAQEEKAKRIIYFDSSDMQTYPDVPNGEVFWDLETIIGRDVLTEERVITKHTDLTIEREQKALANISGEVDVLFYREFEEKLKPPFKIVQKMAHYLVANGTSTDELGAKLADIFKFEEKERASRIIYFDNCNVTRDSYLDLELDRQIEVSRTVLTINGRDILNSEEVEVSLLENEVDYLLAKKPTLYFREGYIVLFLGKTNNTEKPSFEEVQQEAHILASQGKENAKLRDEVEQKLESIYKPHVTSI